MMLRDDDRAARYIHANRIERKPFAILINEFRQKFPQYSDYGRDRIRKHYNLWVEDNCLDRLHKPRNTKPCLHYVFRDKENPHNDPRRASILHLLDLKRAGHSPTRTEIKLAVSPDIIVPAKPEKKEKKKKIKIKKSPPEIKHFNQTPDDLMNAMAVAIYRTPVSTFIRAVSKELKIDEKSIMFRDKRDEIVYARYMIFWLCRQAKYSLPYIGKRFDGRDHTTVLHGVRQFEKHLAEDGQYAAAARRLHRDLITVRPAPYWGA